MEHKGYTGKILYVDLTTETVTEELFGPDLARKYLGGCGMNLRLACDLITPAADPLSPENPILIGAGTLIGPAPGAAKISCTTKLALPATADGRHYVATAMSGSRGFGHMMKRAGFDHIVITGRAGSPVYLEILDGEVKLRGAGSLWGKKDVYETTDALKEAYGRCGVVAIGRAGENLCRFSMAITDKKSTLGRSGVGAVMGSKKLKAIVVQGTREIEVGDRRRLKEAAHRVREKYRRDVKPMGDFSDLEWNLMVMENMNPGVWSKSRWDDLYGEKKYKPIKENISCTACWIGCGDSLEIKEGPLAGASSRTGLYLWVGIIGQKLELEDQGAAVQLFGHMNRLGICAATASSMIDWITRRFEQGVITEEKTGGMVLRRDLDTYLKLTDVIADREGFGDRLAEGWFEASRWVGRDAAEDYVEGSGIAKGTDCIYPARAARLDQQRFTMGVTSPRGGHSAQGASGASLPNTPIELLREECRLNGMSGEDMGRIFQPVPYYGDFNTARLTKHVEDFNFVLNALGVCFIWGGLHLYALEDLAELYSAATGIETTAEEMKRAGERIFNLYKLLNVREGFGRADDAFPEVWLKPLETPDGVQTLKDYYGKKDITAEDLEHLLDDYYDERGWDIEKGVPTREKLADLGLDGILTPHP
jgi:aldehyde:ferredoxin oxidoreductase